MKLSSSVMTTAVVENKVDIGDGLLEFRSTLVVRFSYLLFLMFSFVYSYPF